MNRSVLRSPWAQAVGAAVLLLTPFVVPVPDDLERMRSLRGLGVLAHYGLPAVLTILLHRSGPLKGRLLAAGATAFALSAGCELLQMFVGRHPRLRDAGVDLSGVLTVVGWIGWRRGDGRVWLAALAAGLLVIAEETRELPFFIMAERQAAERFPVLGDFESRLEIHLWDHNEGGHGFFDVVDDGRSRVLRLRAADHHDYPGVLARGLPRDWSAFGTLAFRVRTLEGDVEVTARLDDFASREDALWCGDTFAVGPEWRECVVDLAAAAASVGDRPFRLDDIDSLLLYLTGVDGPTTVLIDDIVLR